MKVTILPILVVNYLNSFQSMAHLTQLSALFWKHSSFQMPCISSWTSHLYLQLYLLLWVSDMPPDFSSDCFIWMSIRNCWHHVTKRKLFISLTLNHSSADFFYLYQWHFRLSCCQTQNLKVRFNFQFSPFTVTQWWFWVQHISGIQFVSKSSLPHSSSRYYLKGIVIYPF